MYATGPPPPAGTPGPRLRLRRGARRAFGDTSAFARDPELPVFMGDLVRPYGLALREEVLAGGRGHTYGEMAEALIPAVVSPDEPVDLLVLAYGIHDVRPGRASATYLSSVCPGTPTAFAVCDQGTVAPFTALRLLGEYARGGCRRALLVVAEQATLHYRPAADGPVPERHAAVALLLDAVPPAVPPRRARAGPDVTQPAGIQPGTGRLGPVRQHGGVAAGRLPGLLARELAELAGDRADLTVLPGPGLAGVPLPAGLRIRPAPAGQPHTGLWWELAGPPSGWTREAGLVLLADRDPGTGALAVAALDFAPAAGAPR